MTKLNHLRDYPVSVAPMMNWTDRHCRYFMRLISPRIRLYTEMITTAAILNGDKDRLLSYNNAEHPLALQLGGADPVALAECANIGEQYGYKEININCGCPSDRVQNGRFGACLMHEPALVARAVEKMSDAVSVPITVKCRIGVDEQDSFDFLTGFIDTVSKAGCEHFIIHARKAWLKGLSPKQNREIPPLDYARVAAIKAAFPNLNITLNGGITDIVTIPDLLKTYDAVMIGREAYHNPWILHQIENIFDSAWQQKREEIARLMAEYARQQRIECGTPVKSITRHILGLYHKQPCARKWRKILSTLPYEEDATEDCILRALDAVKA